MIGQKGLPATHGGIEHHVEQLGSRLAALGHEVVVYTRPNYSDPSITTYKGMTLKSVRSISTKHLDAITHSFLCSLNSRRMPFDIVHYHAIGPCLTAPLARKRDRRIVATIHGQDWRRGKWNAAATLALQAAEHMAVTVPDATISVSRTLAEHYAEGGRHGIHFIPNGVSISSERDPQVLGELGLEPGEYVVFVGRLVPEKGVHYLIEAWRRLGSTRKLVIVGDTSFSDDYVESLLTSEENVLFAGYRYGAELATLFGSAGLFVLPSDLEGLPIVLLESLALGTPVLASDIPPNREILGDQGEYFRAGDVDDLTGRLRELLPRLPELKARAAGLQAGVIAEYDWDRVAKETEQLYASLLGISVGKRRAVHRGHTRHRVCVLFACVYLCSPAGGVPSRFRDNLLRGAHKLDSSEMSRPSASAQFHPRQSRRRIIISRSSPPTFSCRSPRLLAATVLKFGLVRAPVVLGGLGVRTDYAILAAADRPEFPAMLRVRSASTTSTRSSGARASSRASCTR